MSIYIIYFTFVFAIAYNFYWLKKSEKGNANVFKWRIAALIVGLATILYSEKFL